jgi:adenosylcobinamide-GDP ribazoletransferase
MTFLTDLLVCLRFFTRLPLPALAFEHGRPERSLADAAAAVPLAGAVLGVIAACVLVAACGVGLPTTLAAALAVAVLVAVTGALHEDGLADCADGFGGGTTRERKLEIMRDSRIGTFGACALVLSLFIRIEAMAAIAAQSAWLATASLVAAASLSRAACLLPLALLAPARTDGLGAMSGRPQSASVMLAFGAAALLATPALAVGASAPRVLGAALAAVLAGLAMSALAHRQIGGATGDVAGAAQQLADVAVLLVIAASG